MFPISTAMVVLPTTHRLHQNPYQYADDGMDDSKDDDVRPQGRSRCAAFNCSSIDIIQYCIKR